MAIIADKEPLLFQNTFGALRAVTGAAQDALANIKQGETVRIEIKRLQGNVKRMALYWVSIKIAREQLSDAVDGILTSRMLHERLKRDSGLAKPVISKKTGEIFGYDYESISFAKMPEHERQEYIDFALAELSRWIGCDVTDLRNEARVAA